jgi:hypothetical protein
MLFFGVVSAATERVVEFFQTRAEAEAMVDEVREDEPDLAELPCRAVVQLLPCAAT